MRMLTRFDEPLVNHKKIVDHDLKKLIEKMSISDRKYYAPRYRDAVEKCLKHKQPIALFLDEGQHFIKISSGRRLQDQIDVIKSIANITKTTLILFGTYELLELANTSAQAARRTEIIHFDRYRYDIADEYKSFIDLAYSILGTSPIPSSIDPVKSADDLYVYSLGCGGILKDLIGQAINFALAAGDKKLTQKHIEKARFEENAMATIALELKQGEEFFNPNKMGLIQEILGLKFQPPSKEPTKTARSKPGKRNPGRDPVGTTNN